MYLAYLLDPGIRHHWHILKILILYKLYKVTIRLNYTFIIK